MSILLVTVFSALFAIEQPSSIPSAIPTSVPTWVSLSKLADVRHEADDLADEERLRREALQAGESQLAPDDKRLAPLIANLALALHCEGRDSAADPIVRRAVMLAEQSGDRRILGAMLNTLGVVLAGEGDPARAEPVLRRSVAIIEEAGGADSIQAAQAANNLATVYADTRRYAEAEKELKRVLPVYEKVLGPDHPLFAMALGNLFTILYDQHRSAEGEPYLRRALAVGEKKFPESLKMANLRECLAALEVSHQNYKEAARLLEKVIAAQEKLLGPEHPELARTLENYSGVLRHLHQKAEAKTAHNRASLIQKSLLGDVK